ncbi:uncharacterized protein LOC115449534 [Manduca sexta]|uniref:Uncharacterized protein n=1 Tax=Manduca sexta TaxID=7130 RepID=A0A922CU59_MANSE|nr:uncharacterized protein LOC115449534 [Manduca sexta]KAG6459575.1 hypothetical protein O3G_MSEX011448 [Manduca sexta]
MNVNSVLSPRMMVGAAIVGIVGAAGVFIYEQIYAEKRRSMLVREVARLDKQVASIRSELESLRELQKETQLRRMKQKKSEKARRERVAAKAAPSGDNVDNTDVPEQSYASDSEYFTDYQSVLGTDGEMDSEEFYDVHTDDDEDDTLQETLHNGHVSSVNEESQDKENVPKTTEKAST